MEAILRAREELMGAGFRVAPKADNFLGFAHPLVIGPARARTKRHRSRRKRMASRWPRQPRQPLVTLDELERWRGGSSR
jgi:hypothetical protein